MNLKTKANLQNQLTDNCGQAVFLLLLTAQNLHTTEPAFRSRFLAQNRNFFHRSYHSAWFALRTPLPENTRQPHFFFCSVPVPAWLVKCTSTKPRGSGSVFPWFSCSFPGWFYKCCGCSVCLGFGDAHLPCRVQDAITNASCYKCQTLGFLCI